MNKLKIDIVWFKRDLRTDDHAPLHSALLNNTAVGLYIFEPEWFQSAEFSERHLYFVLESLKELQNDLQKIGVPLMVFQGRASDIFRQLAHLFKIDHVYSHEETGLDWSYQRDLKIKTVLSELGIPWLERRQFGVVRPLLSRDEWAQQRSRIIERPLVPKRAQNNFDIGRTFFDLPVLNITPSETQFLQKPGTLAAKQYLNSFLNERGLDYMRSLSKPAKAFHGCSRISSYLSYGNISLTQVFHELKFKRKYLASSPHSGAWYHSLNQFESRLWWHCHFIQKLESEPAIEFSNFNREFDGMRDEQFVQEVDRQRFEAWSRGETGFPLVDACMRALIKHGWINFRMRAMLMSFACYQLWLHWKKPAEHLAKLFVDFEPGIHYSQAQMQSGVTGINAIRIYSPEKQLYDQDPEGVFVKTYVPELKDIDVADLANPHDMPPLLKLHLGFNSSHYPMPIVDAKQSYDLAREKIFSWRQKKEVILSSKKVYQKHGSRAGKHFPKQNRGQKN